MEEKSKLQLQLAKSVRPQRYYSREGLVYFYNLIRFIGLDNLNRHWLYVIYSVQQIASTNIFEIIGFTISYVKRSAGMDIGTFLTSLQVCVNVYIIIPKMFYVYWYMGRIRETAVVFDKLDAKIKTPKEIEAAERMALFARRIVLFYVCIYLSYSSSTFLSAILNGHPPYALYIPFCNWEESKKKMIIASFIEYYLMNLSCIQDVGLDVLPVVFMYMARMHMKILSIRVERLGKDPNISKEENVRMLVDCVDTHRKFLELIEIVRPIVSKTLFCQILAAVLVMAITFVNIMMFSNFASIVASVFFLVAVTLQTLPICYEMNVLKEEVNSLPTSAFHSGWMHQNRLFRNMLLFFIQNTQKFRPIIAGNIIPIEVATYLTIGKLSFSVYALVSKVAQRREARAGHLE